MNRAVITFVTPTSHEAVVREEGAPDALVADLVRFCMREHNELGTRFASWCRVAGRPVPRRFHRVRTMTLDFLYHVHVTTGGAEISVYRITRRRLQEVATLTVAIAGVSA